MVIRETVSSYRRIMIISDEQHETLIDAFLILGSDFNSPWDGDIHIRVDAAPAFQCLATLPPSPKRASLLFWAK